MVYKCNKCGKMFKEPSVIQYREYPGGALADEYMSPCCEADFEEVE